MPTTARTIDAHCHVWPGAPGTTAAPREPADYSIETHLARLAEHGIEATVLVPHIAYDGRDLGYLHACAARYPGRCAVMGAITGAEVAEPHRLDDDIAQGVRAFRIRAADMHVPLDALCEYLARSGGVLCPLVTRAQARAGALDAIGPLADRHPALRFVLDHFGGDHNAPALAQLARRANILIKVSDFGAFDQPPYDAARAATVAMCALFGAQRLMWGSNLPVFALDARQDLGAAWHAIRDATSLGDAERAAILGGTAATVFFPH